MREDQLARSNRVHRKGERHTRHGNHEGSSDDALGSRIIPFEKIRVSSLWSYRRCVAREWREAITCLSREGQSAQSKRLDSFMRCGSHLSVRVCDGCGGGREGSGSYEGTRTCKTRCCPTCGWIRSKRQGEHVERAFELLPALENSWHWQLLVLTLKYDPTNPKDLEVLALRHRAMEAIRLSKKVWGRLLKIPGAAALRSIECSSRGHVHLNLVYFGPPVDRSELEDVAGAVDCPSAGKVHVSRLDCDPGSKDPVEDPRGSQKAATRAAAYISKGIEHGAGAWQEGWLAGDHTATTIDPRLAARWEVAAYKLQLQQRYGALRKLPEPEEPEPKKVPVDDADTACGGCGTVGEWHSQVVRADKWAMACHAQGLRALARSPADDWGEGKAMAGPEP